MPRPRRPRRSRPRPAPSSGRPCRLLRRQGGRRRPRGAVSASGPAATSCLAAGLSPAADLAPPRRAGRVVRNSPWSDRRGPGGEPVPGAAGQPPSPSEAPPAARGPACWPPVEPDLRDAAVRHPTEAEALDPRGVLNSFSPPSSPAASPITCLPEPSGRVALGPAARPGGLAARARGEQRGGAEGSPGPPPGRRVGPTGI